MRFSIHPFFLIAAIGALGAIVAALFACRVSKGFSRFSLLLLAAVLFAPTAYLFVVMHPGLFEPRFRAYNGFYRDIEIGMTREQVLAALERRYPASGPRQKPKVWQDHPTTLNFFMNPETSREPNCEGIFLTLEQGRVTNKHYSPD